MPLKLYHRTSARHDLKARYDVWVVSLGYSRGCSDWVLIVFTYCFVDEGACTGFLCVVVHVSDIPIWQICAIEGACNAQRLFEQHRVCTIYCNASD